MEVTARKLMGFLLLLTILTTSLTPSTAALATGYPGKNRTALVVPTAISPTGIITDTTPAFKWTRVTGATKYQYRLYKGASSTPLWTKEVITSACGSSTLYCTQTPTVPLALANYKWQVRAFDGITWTSFSAFKSFMPTNVPTSFDSEFNSSMAGWKKMGTILWYVSSSAIYPDNSLTEEKCANVYKTQSIAFKNVDYSARTKCLTSTPGYCENYLAVRMGTKTDSSENCWYPGYIFGYDDDGYAKIRKITKDGQWENAYSQYSNKVNKTSYNTIRVSANGTSFKFYINGTYITTYTDSTYKIGAIGILMWEYGTTQMNVDWAKATVLP